MKIAYRKGHVYGCPGAHSDICDETQENRRYAPDVFSIVAQDGWETIDCTPSESINDQNTDLDTGTDNMINVNPDMFISCHLNNCYTHYNGAIGSEIWVYPGDTKAATTANRILANLASLGFKNRGVKYSTGLHDLRVPHINGISAMIIEGFFVEATEDVALYREKFQEFCKVIAQGIVGHSIGAPVPVVVPTVQYANDSLAQKIADAREYVGTRCKELQEKLNKVMKINLVVDGDFGPKTYGALTGFQNTHGLTPDGYAGPLTFAKLDEIIAEMNKPAPIPTPVFEPKVDNYALAVQKKLNQLHITDSNGQRLAEDGDYGPKTRYAVTRFQNIIGIDADGNWGTVTEDCFNKIAAKSYCSISNKPDKVVVRYIQWRVNTSVDGDWGPMTDAAIKRFQGSNGLLTDAKVGTMTWGKLL